MLNILLNNRIRLPEASIIASLSAALLSAGLVGGCATPGTSSDDEGTGGEQAVGTGGEQAVGSDAESCVAGLQQECPCAGDEDNNVQVCNAAGTWDPCQCAGAPAAAGGDGTGDGSGGAAAAGTGGDTAGTGGENDGTGGDSQQSDPCFTSVTDMVSDMEEAVTNKPPMLNTHETRQGEWFSDSAPGASIIGAESLDVELTTERCESARAVYATGYASDWGALVGFDFNASSGMKTAYNIPSSATGIAFFAKGTGTIRVELFTTQLDGGDGYHGVDYILTADWSLVEIPFDTLEQPDWTTASIVDLDRDEALGVQFKVEEPGDIEFWIDDVGFY